MNRRGCADSVAVAVLITLGVSILASFFVCLEAQHDGWEHGVNETRAAAIEAGVGYWAIDEKTGERRFEWRTETKEKE